jgi:lipoate-protein ligase A
VTVWGRKLVGSAQVRRRGVVLQHGALPLAGDVARLADVLALPTEERQALRVQLSKRAIALDEALGRSVTWAEVSKALSAGFADALNLRLAPGDLSSRELAAATRLQVRYGGDEWMYSR